jgi:hypothetical protein
MRLFRHLPHAGELRRRRSYDPLAVLGRAVALSGWTVIFLSC